MVITGAILTTWSGMKTLAFMAFSMRDISRCDACLPCQGMYKRYDSMHDITRVGRGGGGGGGEKGGGGGQLEVSRYH